MKNKTFSITYGFPKTHIFIIIVFSLSETFDTGLIKIVINLTNVTFTVDKYKCLTHIVNVHIFKNINLKKIDVY